MKIADLHCDTISFLQQNDSSLASNNGQYDLGRAVKAGIKLQFFAMFTHPDEPNRSLRLILKQLSKFYQEMEANQEWIQQVRVYDDILTTDQAGKIGAVLHLEGAECLGYDLDLFYLLYRAGLRSIGLTWNARNQFAAGVSEGDAAGGLSKLGRRLAAEMDRLGVVLDLSHISKGSFYDALEYYSKPVFVTHANVFNLCPHPRNLDDQQLKKLAEHGGLIGITQVADFVNLERKDLDAMLDHMVYIADLIGIDYLALGSDFDGADNMIINEVSGYECLPEMLQNRGFTAAETEKILFGNVMKNLKQIF
ncbi:MAG TPA: dipeptidase [Syntrophomonas sp.]|nr:dipeptidase [Syntrophomonas sp.]